MSLPPEAKKAYGIVSAVGTRIGEKARESPAILDEIRAAPDIEAFRAAVRAHAEGRLPEAVLAQFLQQVVQDADWTQWRARLLVQAKLTREGGKPAPGHEAGRGVGGP